MQRLLARFGYIRLADHGLVMTPYGVVRAPHWPQETGSWPYDAPRVGYGIEALPGLAYVPPGAGEEPAESVVPITMNEVSSLAVRADTDTDDNSTTVAQPLRGYYLPLSPSQEHASDVFVPAPLSKWGTPEGNATLVVDAKPFVARMLSEEDEQTLFSPAPIHSPRISTPPP